MNPISSECPNANSCYDSQIDRRHHHTSLNPVQYSTLASISEEQELEYVQKRNENFCDPDKHSCNPPLQFKPLKHQKAGQNIDYDKAPIRGNRLKKGPTSNSYYTITISSINSIYNYLPGIVAMIWAAVVYFGMPAISRG